jgi:hypothetical protein
MDDWLLWFHLERTTQEGLTLDSWRKKLTKPEASTVSIIAQHLEIHWRDALGRFTDCKKTVKPVL